MVLLINKHSILDVWTSVSRDVPSPTTIQELHWLWDVIESIRKLKHPKISLILRPWDWARADWVFSTIKTCRASVSWLQLHLRIVYDSQDVSFKKQWTERATKLLFFDKESSIASDSLVLAIQDESRNRSIQAFVSFLKTLQVYFSVA